MNEADFFDDPEHRRFDRYVTDNLVWWNHDWEPEPIALRDISAGGMLCEFPRYVEPGEIVGLSFEIRTYDQMIFCECEAVHSRAIENHFYLVGLKIHQLESMSQAQFYKLLREAYQGEKVSE